MFRHNRKTIPLQYIVTLILFLIGDFIWLGIVAKNMYAQAIGHLMAPTPNWIAAAVFYFLFASAVLFFVIAPAKKDIGKAAVSGALFGFFCYATYDLTNLATLRDWPVWLSGVDMLWGATLTGLVSAGTVFFTRKKL